MAVTTDISTIRDIHPPNKQEVGRRLALWALAKTYGKTDVVFSGPMYEAMSVENDQVKIKFKPGHGGLKSRDGNPLTWFSIAGSDKKFVPATATIDGEMVVVKSPQVATPVAVRFGWHQAAEPNLCNQAGLPAVPFRTDTWGDAISAEPPGS
jgi:sialate O-acetylesterase